MQGEHFMTKRSMRSTVQQIRAKHGLTRRGFLKTSAVATAAVAGVGGLSAKLFFENKAANAASAINIWNLPAFVPASGTYKPDSTWKSFTSQYKFPTWYRNAKYGIWGHWSPQSVPEYGDWYALYMYQQGTKQYKYHLSHYGHPSKFGYKDITHLFTGSAWNPNALLKIYAQQGGAKYFMALANHHDNYDNWDSTYQPWNSKTVGRKSSIIGEWAAATRAQGIKFGVTYHACPIPSWTLFLPARYGHDTSGTYKNVPYDGRVTAADGVGKWWNGLDPVDLNAPVHTTSGYRPSESDPFTRQFYYRVDDLITKHQPDILYFDDSIGPTGPVGVGWDIPNQAYVIAANYYNKSLKWNNGAMSVILNIKNVPSNLLSVIAQDWEKKIAPTTQPYPWQAENSLGDWHYYAPNPITMSAATLINNIKTTVSRNGNYLINVPQHGDGHIDQKAIDIITQAGTWLKTNGLAIYDTRPFAIDTEGDVSYTRNGSDIFAIATTIPSDNNVVLTHLKKGSPYLGNVTQVELLGHPGTHAFTHTTEALTIYAPANAAESHAYSFKITHDRPLVNNDDEGVEYEGKGWFHEVNRGIGNTNNNVHITTENGDSVSYTFTGTGIEFITETDTTHGKVAVYIDNVHHKTVNAFSTLHGVQVSLHSVQGLSAGEHTIKLVKVSGDRMILDAFKVL
jgi:alpha-L-fucosidase